MNTKIFLQTTLLFVCGARVWTANTTPEPFDAENIILHAPTNLRILYRKPTEVYLYWFPPQNYEVHIPPNDTNGEYSLGIYSNNTLVSTVAPYHIANQNRNGSQTIKHENGTSSSSSPTDSPKNTSTETSDTLNDKSKKNEVTDLPSDKVSKTENETDREQLSDLKGLLLVPFHEAHIDKYIVTYYSLLTGLKNVQTQDVAKNKTEVHITELEPGTEYVVFVSVVYITRTVLNSTNITFNTTESSEDDCTCHAQGTVRGEQKCSRTSEVWCHCQTGYTGLFCEVCAPRYYRLKPQFPCYACPCTGSSSGTCHLEEGYLHCDWCKKGYIGNLCHHCAEGYVRDNRNSRNCIPCNCHGNHFPLQPPLCDEVTGACSSCYFNTSGFNCEHCREGYVGDPLNHTNCTMAETQWAPPTKLIAGICVGVILILSVIVGFFVYKKWRNFPARRPFWTVELKEGQERVSFSSMADEDAYMDDMDFYEKQGARQGRKSEQPYSPLRENI